MSDTSEPKGRIGADKIILAGVALILVIALLFVSTGRQQDLRNSATGLDGLGIWLGSEGIDTQRFTGGWPLQAEEIGLIIVPLYDTQLGKDRNAPRTKEELVFQTDEYDLTWSPIQRKAETVRTIVVLPKWRSGMRLTKLGHPALVIPGKDVAALGRRFVDGGNFELSYARTPFSEFSYTATDGDRRGALIYAAQMFSSTACDPVVGTPDAMIVGDCALRSDEADKRVLIVSDPDFLNNHGLVLGQNATIVRDLVKSYAGEKRVIVDYSRINWLTTGAGRPDRERTWSDLKRFFTPPFTLIWIGAGLVFALVLWRAGLRFGPAAAALTRKGASKTLAIAARARLMLLSGRYGAMAGDYMRARLATTATEIFGSAHGRGFSSPETFLDYAKRRHADHATPLADAMGAIESLPAQASSRQAMDTIDTLDAILENIAHDTRSAQRTR